MADVPEITVAELKRWRDEDRPHVLVDVREIHEVAAGHLGGIHIPMAWCLARKHELPRDIPVVVHCKSGGRAAAVVSALMEKGGFDNVYNLRGGITAWVTEIDQGIEIG